MTSTVDKLRAHYRAGGSALTRGASDHDISSFERRHAIRLPAEVAAFYRAINGAESVGESLFELWPLERVGSVPDVVVPSQGIPSYGRIAQVLPDAGDYFAFADCLIWSHVLAVRLRPPTSSSDVVWLCGSSYAKVAASFDEFWERFIEEPDAVLWPSEALVVTPEP